MSWQGGQEMHAQRHWNFIMNATRIPIQPSKRPVRSHTTSAFHPSPLKFHPSTAPLSPQTPSLPVSDPANDATREKQIPFSRVSWSHRANELLDFPPLRAPCPIDEAPSQPEHREDDPPGRPRQPRLRRATPQDSSEREENGGACEGKEKVVEVVGNEGGHGASDLRNAGIGPDRFRTLPLVTLRKAWPTTSQ